MFSFRNIITSSIIILLLDYVYLRLTKNYFERQIKQIQGSTLVIRWLPVILCYLFIILGYNYFILFPKKNIQEAFFLGIFVYGVYELTNFALFTNWSLLTVVMDTLWGGILFALTTLLFYYIQKMF